MAVGDNAAGWAATGVIAAKINSPLNRLMMEEIITKSPN